MGEATILFGTLAAYCVWRLNKHGMKPAELRIATAAVCALVAGHLFTMGYDGWLQVQKWNGGLPPITLLSFCMVVTGLTVFLWATEKRVSLSFESGPVLHSGMDSQKS
jgi:hypothetical protein